MSEAEAQIRQGLALVAALPANTEAQQLELELADASWKRVVRDIGVCSSGVATAFIRARQLCEKLDRPHDLAVLLSSQSIYHVLALVNLTWLIRKTTPVWLSRGRETIQTSSLLATQLALLRDFILGILQLPTETPLKP